MQKLVKKSTDKTDTPWGLDWFVQAGHGGSGNRNCTLVEDATPGHAGLPAVVGRGTAGPDAPPGEHNSGVHAQGRRARAPAPNQNMWRWQSVQEFQYPLHRVPGRATRTCRCSSASTVVAGPRAHLDVGDHRPDAGRARHGRRCPTAPAYTPLGNATALAQWEYCFDRGDARHQPRRRQQLGLLGAGQPQRGRSRAGTRPAQKLVPAGGAGTGDRGHTKTLEAVKWMAAFHPNGSYYVPAHLERAGPFNPNGNNGFNIEHLRNFNNAGAEGRVRHGDPARPRRLGRARRIPAAPQQHRRRRRPTRVGGTTYGGTGVYGAQIGGVWDALLGEGRNWWFFASSDWHNRGSFGPDDRRTTQDFYPGEYQRNYTMVRNGGDDKLRPQTIVDGLRTGNTFVDQRPAHRSPGLRRLRRHPGAARRAATPAVAAMRRSTRAMNNTDDRLRAAAPRWARSWWCRRARTSSSAIVGARPGGHELLAVHLPQPVAAQVGINQPLNKPVLDHIDLIRGLVTGYKTPGRARLRRRVAAQHRLAAAPTARRADLSAVPAAAKNTTRGDPPDLQRQRRTPGRAVARRRHHFLTMTFRIPAVHGLAVRAPARHQPAAACRSRPTPAATRCADVYHQRRATATHAAHPLHDGPAQLPATSSTAARTTWRSTAARTT